MKHKMQLILFALAAAAVLLIPKQAYAETIKQVANEIQTDENGNVITAEEIAETEEEEEEESEVSVTEAGQVVDSFLGVDALYRPGGADNSDTTYSCAAYAKRFYSEIFGLTINGLFGPCTPNVVGDDYFVKVTEPYPGDVVLDRGTHWAIVKSVNDDGTVTVIEQNYKWSAGGGTVAAKNRRIAVSSIVLFRLNSQLEVVEQAMEDGITNIYRNYQMEADSVTATDNSKN